MPTATSTIEVDVPVTTAYNQWTQFESFPRFMDGVENVQQLDDSLTHWTISVGGVTREYDARITDQTPDKRIEWHSIGELKQGGRVEFQPLGGDRTEVTLHLDWEPEGLAENVGAALQVDDAMVKMDLEQFKEFIESRGTEEGAWRGEINDGQSEGQKDRALDEGFGSDRRTGLSGPEAGDVLDPDYQEDPADPLSDSASTPRMPPYPNRYPGIM